MLTRSTLIMAIAASLLAGCGAAPLAAQRVAAADLAAKVDTSRHRKSLVVPASVMAFADDYIEKQQAALNKGATSAHFLVTLEASANDFKRTFDAKVDQTNPRNKGGSQTFLLDEDCPSGELAYYMVVTGSVVTESKNGIKIDEVAPFFISNYGKNWKTTAR
ncbi:MAG: hypothetical protein JWM80_6007 [Cyanobacteria bacterium RYN_339]|nr:hypothetical protein [Cyanobacteria bacterium RYN_339]